ncbi:MAG: T9SS type A sorting domain-containing protein [Bacteroidetes bacterium]|nr:MAG: T9SS type A sorting domain-containing protein [Bacteroidota bacterium]
MNSKQLVKALLVIGFLLTSQYGKAQIRINEICAANNSTIQNNAGEYKDWIELYNAGGSSVNLSGYGLTDETSSPYRFVFPNYVMAPGSHLLVFAADSNSTDLVDHWETAVTANSTWRYFIGTSEPDTNWRNPSFNPAGWPSGPGGFGFGDGDDATSFPICASVMIRKTFTVPDTSDIIKTIFHIDYDDGFVAYLNGVEIARANLGIQGDRPGYNVFAPVTKEAVMYQGFRPDSFFIDRDLIRQILVQGTNVLAVQVHNTTILSNDLTALPFLSFGMKSPGSTFGPVPTWFQAPVKDYFNAKFKLTRTGETVYLYNASSSIIDQVVYPGLELDNSYGRAPDGNSSWCYFGTPSPDATNPPGTCYIGYASQPVFSNSAGFYPSPIWLTLSNSTPGATVRYSSNGNDPTPSTSAYSAPILLSNTRTIRAKTFAPGYLPSPTVTNSFFISEDIHLPIFTITTDSLNLWDYNTGIYAFGPNAQPIFPYKDANFWQDWRKVSTLEYYDENKSRAMRFDAELSIYGNYSRGHAQKSFEIRLSDKYGTGEINYPLYTTKPWLNKNDNFILRNSGTDWNVVHFRDAMMERIMKDTYADYLAANPAVVYLNGDFWGVYTIHENHDQHWMQNNYNLKKSEIDYLKESGSNVELKLGSDTSFWAMYNYATTNDSTTMAYYNEMNSRLDLRNYADYFIAETYYDNGDWLGDWTNNIKMWRPTTGDKKWRYLLYDLDFGFGLYNGVNDNRLGMARNPTAFSYSSKMFKAMLANPTFKRYFINRYADLMNTIYLPSSINSVMMSYRDSMAHDMQAHFAKWGSNLTNWAANIDTMMRFVNARPNTARAHIVSEFSLNSQVTLTLNVSPAGAGRIQISTITPTTYPWNGIYFNGNPVTLTAIPNPGYSFDHFRSNIVINSNNFNQSVTYNFTSTDQITAYFTGTSASPLLTLSEINYNSSSSVDGGDWVELHNYGNFALNISGWKFRDDQDHHVYTIPVGTVIPAGGYLVLAEDMDKFTALYPSVTNVRGPIGFNLNNAGEQIRLYNHLDNLYLSVFYQNIAPWPLLANGQGYTCERTSTVNDPNNGNSWFSGCIGGSPGAAPGNILAGTLSITGNSTFCIGGSAQLAVTVVPGYQYQWQRNTGNIPGATDTVFTATSGGTYTVVASFNGCSSVSESFLVSVVSQGPDPVVNNTYRCGPGSITLNASSTDTIYWFDSPGGNLVNTGTQYSTPQLNNTTTYYLQTSLACPSNLVSLEVQILAITATPQGSDVNRCGPGTVLLSATDTSSIRWYSAFVGGALVHSGSSFTSPVLFRDTTFFAEAGDICPSARLGINVTVNTSPMPVGTDGSRCGEGTVTLTASSASPITWYDAPYGGNQVGTGTVFVTPVLTADASYFAEANAACPSVRAEVLAIVDPIPDPPVTSDEARCGVGSVTLIASSPSQVYWYDAPLGGNLLHTGTNFTTPVLTSNTVYYAEAGFDCRGPRDTVSAIINTIPTVFLGNDTMIAMGGTLLLDAGPGFVSYAWSNGASTQTITVGSTNTYSVLVLDSNGCSNSDDIFVEVSVGTEEISFNSSVIVYPNPVKDILRIEIFANRVSETLIRLSDVQGRVLQSLDTKLSSGQNNFNLNLANTSNGIYFLEILTEKSNEVLRILKQ